MDKRLPKVELWTDGCALHEGGSGGVAGWSVIIVVGSSQKEYYGSVDYATSTQAEMTAVIKGLRLLKQPCRVTVCTDLKLLVDTGRRVAKRKLNMNFWVSLDASIEERNHHVYWRWIQSHSGIEKNELAHFLARQAAKGALPR